MSFFTRGFLGGITGANKRRRRRGLAYDAEIKGPDQTNLGTSVDSATLGSVRWQPRRFSTIYQSRQYREGRRVFADSLTAPTVYGGGLPQNPASSAPSMPPGPTTPAMPNQILDPMTGLPLDNFGLSSLR